MVFESNKEQLDDLISGLKKLNQHFLDQNLAAYSPVIIAQEYRQIAITLYEQSHLLLRVQHRKKLKSICMALVFFAQKLESFSDPTYINKFQKKLEPLMHESYQFGVTVVRPLCQQISAYLAGHRGICAIAARAWLANHFMSHAPNIVVTNIAGGCFDNFIKKVEFQKEELYFLYELEKHRKKIALTFFLVTGLRRLSNGVMLLALLDELSENKNVLFLITFAHFRHRHFHAVACKFSQELIQWFDSDCGIFQSQNKDNFSKWLDFYLKHNQYQDKFSFFTVHKGEPAPRLTDRLSNGIKYIRHL